MKCLTGVVAPSILRPSTSNPSTPSSAKSNLDRQDGRRRTVTCQAIDLNLAEQPAIQPIKYLRIGGLIEFVAKPDQRFEVGHARKAEESLQNRVMPDDFRMLETIASAPDVEQKLRGS